VTSLQRKKTFKVWLVDKGEIHRGRYESAALPAVGDTILVRRMEIDAEGSWRPIRAKPVSASVSRVRGGMITAATRNPAELHEAV
jgi:hypothetical protein